MIGAGAIGVFVGNNIAGYAIKRGLDNLIKDRQTFENRLAKVIDKTIDEYDKKYTYRADNKFPFFKSQVFIDELINFRIFHKVGYVFNLSRIQEELNKNPNIISISEDQLNQFLDLFISNANSDEYLSTLEIREYYKEEIFEISAEVTKLTRLISEFNEGMITLLEGEYIRELTEFLADIESFKPSSALRKIEALEAELIKNNKFVSESLKARLYYIKALCSVELHNSIEANKLFIKAYKLETGNTFYRQRACYSYFILKDTTWLTLCEEILRTEDYDPYAWAAKCMNNSISDVLVFIEKSVPRIVRQDSLFRRIIFNYCFNYLPDLVPELIEIFPFNETLKSLPDTITYQNIHHWILISNISNSLIFGLINIPFTGIIDHDERLSFWIALSDQILSRIKNTEVEDQFNLMYFMNLWLKSEISGNEISIELFRSIFNSLKQKDQFRAFLYANTLQKKGFVDEALATIRSFSNIFDINLLSLKAFCYLRKQDADNFIQTVREYLSGSTEINDLNIYATLNLLHLVAVLPDNPNGLIEILESLSTTDNSYLKLCSLLLKSQNKSTDRKQVREETDALDEELLADPIIAFFIAEIYFNICEYKSCVNTIKLYLDESVPSRDFSLYITALDQLKTEGQLELLRVLKIWRTNNFPFDERLIRLELDLNQLINNWIEIEIIAEYGLNVQPANEAFITIYAISLNINKQNDKLAEIIPIIGALVFTDTNFALKVANVLLQHQYYQESLDIVYSQAKDATNLVARLNYIHLTSQMPEGFLKDFEEVKVGTHLKYSVDGIKAIVPINDKNSKESKLLREAIGRKKGETFTLITPISRRPNQVILIRIMDKYLSLFEEILQQAENPHSGLGLEMANFDGYSKENIEKFLIDMLGVSGEETKNIREKNFLEYASGIISFSQLARSNFDFNFIATYYNLTESQKSCYNIAPTKYYANRIDLIHDKIVIDIPTGILFYELSKQIPLTFGKFIVPPSLISEINHQIHKAESEINSKMSITVETSRIIPILYSDEFHQQRIAHFNSILLWFTDNCIQEEPVEKIDLIRQLRENERFEPSFNYIVDLLVLSRRDNYIMLTDDSFFFQLIPPVSGETISSELYLTAKYPSDIDEIYSFLLEKRFKGLTLNRNVLLKAYSSQSKPNKSNIWPQTLDNLSLRLSFKPATLVECVMFLKDHSLSKIITPDKYRFDAINLFTSLLISIPNPAIFRFLVDQINETFKLLPQQKQITQDALFLALKILNSGDDYKA